MFKIDVWAFYTTLMFLQEPSIKTKSNVKRVIYNQKVADDLGFILCGAVTLIAYQFLDMNFFVKK